MTTLKEELAAYTSDLVARTGTDAAANLFEGQIGAAKMVVDDAARKGQQVPEFELPDGNGKRVALGSRLNNGPVVLTFYRGGWCPYCNIALRALQLCLPEIQRYGGGLIAISPEVPDQSLNTQEKLRLGFDVLSDQGNVVARRFGLVYRVADTAQERLLALGRDLVAHNGSQTWEIPITATYVVNPNGMIVFDHVDSDYRNRLDPAVIVEVLQSLASSDINQPS
jgi:peroxiredoxin